MRPRMTQAHRNTTRAILRRSVAHHLHWRGVRSMLRALAEVVAEPYGSAGTRNGHAIVLHPYRRRGLGTEEQLTALRTTPEQPDAGLTPSEGGGVNPLIVISHRRGRVARAGLFFGPLMVHEHHPTGNRLVAGARGFPGEVTPAVATGCGGPADGAPARAQEARMGERLGMERSGS